MYKITINYYETLYLLYIYYTFTTHLPAGSEGCEQHAAASSGAEGGAAGSAKLGFPLSPMAFTRCGKCIPVGLAGLEITLELVPAALDFACTSGLKSDFLDKAREVPEEIFGSYEVHRANVLPTRFGVYADDSGSSFGGVESRGKNLEAKQNHSSRNRPGPPAMPPNRQVAQARNGTTLPISRPRR